MRVSACKDEHSFFYLNDLAFTNGEPPVLGEDILKIFLFERNQTKRLDKPKKAT
jgi:hypothetical protein